MKIRKKTLAVFCVLASLSYVFPISVFAQEKVAELQAVEADNIPAAEETNAIDAEVVLEAPSMPAFSGTVKAIDVEGQNITVQPLTVGEEPVQEDTVFYFSEKMDVLKNDQPSSTSDLKEGDQVVIEYEVNASGNKIIHVLAVKG